MAKGLIVLLLALLSTRVMNAQPPAQTRTRCTCGNGQSLEVGAVSYSQDSGRETITRLEPAPAISGNRCRALWVGSTEVRPVGTPFDFHLERTRARETRIDGCEDLSGRFVTRTTKYEFVFDSNAVSIREIRVVPGSGGAVIPDPRGKSNSTLWNSIAEVTPPDSADRGGRAARIDSTREFNRSSWILARTGIKAHHVGIVRDAYGVERVVPLRKTRAIKAGQLGQIEAVGPGRAIVRFYEGSRIGRFGRTANAFRRWYHRIGGPYQETNDDLFTPFRACILEVSLDDIVEINDYLDQGHTDHT